MDSYYEQLTEEQRIHERKLLMMYAWRVTQILNDAGEFITDPPWLMTAASVVSTAPDFVHEPQPPFSLADIVETNTLNELHHEQPTGSGDALANAINMLAEGVAIVRQLYGQSDIYSLGVADWLLRADADIEAHAELVGDDQRGDMGV